MRRIHQKHLLIYLSTIQIMELFEGEIIAEEDALVVNGKRVQIVTDRDPLKLTLERAWC